MYALIKTQGGPIEVSAAESGQVPGVVRLKLGAGEISFVVYLSPYEAAQVGLKAVEASRVAAEAALREAGA